MEGRGRTHNEQPKTCVHIGVHMLAISTYKANVPKQVTVQQLGHYVDQLQKLRCSRQTDTGTNPTDRAALHRSMQRDSCQSVTARLVYLASSSQTADVMNLARS